jgi:hypothetical protein
MRLAEDELLGDIQAVQGRELLWEGERLAGHMVVAAVGNIRQVPDWGLDGRKCQQRERRIQRRSA